MLSYLIACLAALALATATTAASTASLLHSVTSTLPHVQVLPTAPPATALYSVLLTLAQPDPTLAARLVAERADPSSPLYLQWFDKATLGALLAPQPYSVANVSEWVSGVAGASVVSVWGPYVQVEGSVSAIEQLFNTTLSYYTNTRSNTTSIRQSGESYIPAALDTHIVHVDGLDVGDIASPVRAIVHKPHSSTRFRPLMYDGCYTSAELNERYGTPNTITSTTTNTNAATSVGVIQLEDTENYDLNALYLFGHNEGFAISNLSTLVTAIELISPHATNTPTTGSNDESMLDLEAVVSVTTTSQLYAMKVGQTDANTPGNLFTYFRDASPLPQVMSLSYSYEESEFRSGTLTSYESQVQALTALGVTFLAATGDDGYNTDIGWPATSAYALAVGGTTFSGTGVSITEAAWDDSTGGLSSAIARPSYQTTANTGISTTFRAVPDVSALAYDWYLVYGDQGSEKAGEVGGTSLATPIWAGVITYLNAISLRLKGTTLGFVNPTLYTMAANCSTCFHDITTGSSNGYSAKVGYDLITGLGSPNLPAMEAYLTALLSGTAASTATPSAVHSSSSTATPRGVPSSTAAGRVVSSTAAPVLPSTAPARVSSTAAAPVAPPSSTASAAQCTLNPSSTVGSFNNNRFNAEDSAPAGGLYTSPITLGSSFSVAGLGVQLPPAAREQQRSQSSVIQLALYAETASDTFTLLASTAPVIITGSGGDIIAPLTTTTPLQLSAGNTVYVALFVQSSTAGVVVYAQNNHPSSIGPSISATSLPASFTTNNGNYPFRAELVACQ